MRALVDRVHEGNIREASLLTGLAYPTIRDLYVGSTANPSIETLERLRRPYGVEFAWFTDPELPDQQPREGCRGLVPPKPGSGARQRALREVLVPFGAWPMYVVMDRLEQRLRSMAAGPERPIVGEASGDALTFRLTTFLLQPLLAAEKIGADSVVLTLTEYMACSSDRQYGLRRSWIARLRTLGETWQAVLQEFLARGE